MWSVLGSRTQRHIWVELVVGSFLCSEKITIGTPNMAQIKALILVVMDAILVWILRLLGYAIAEIASITARIIALLDFLCAAQSMIDFIYHFVNWFIPYMKFRTHRWPAPNVSGFIVQLVCASHRYREVTDSNPVEVLKISGFFTQLLKMRP